MKPDLIITRSSSGRTLEIRMKGLFTEPDIIDAANLMRREVDLMNDRRHIVIADMRGLKTLAPAISHHMGAAMGYDRAHGCVLCVHISDDIVQRLQISRLGRQHSTEDDVTIEAGSIEEARRIAKSYERFLDDNRFSKSIRAALPVYA